MRLGYILYIVGVILLIGAGYVVYNSATLEPVLGGKLIYGAIVFVSLLFGFTSFIFGYSLRPKKYRLRTISPTTVSVESLSKITRVKGIGDRRADQLKELGIVTVADLSVASAEELAESLQTSTKIVDQWIKDARTLLLEN
ncbi:MAG: hypothetical protein JSW72_04215 [Candidatus Bathyarchaeota archaeon]|nr:MAG: hypothetical protein JSW72_04215 [Candidatus Bathyarchaeota archaeon]